MLHSLVLNGKSINRTLTSKVIFGLFFLSRLLSVPSKTHQFACCLGKPSECVIPFTSVASLSTFHHANLANQIRVISREMVLRYNPAFPSNFRWNRFQALVWFFMFHTCVVMLVTRAPNGLSAMQRSRHTWSLCNCVEMLRRLAPVIE